MKDTHTYINQERTKVRKQERPTNTTKHTKQQTERQNTQNKIKNE